MRNSAHPLNGSRGPEPRGVGRGTPDGACRRTEIESRLHVGCKEASRAASSERFVFKYAGEEQQSSAYYAALLTARLSLSKGTTLSLVISEKCPQENGGGNIFAAVLHWVARLCSSSGLVLKLAVVWKKKGKLHTTPRSL